MRVELTPPRSFREYRRRYDRLLSIAHSEGLTGGDAATVRQRPDYVRCDTELRLYERAASVPMKIVICFYLCARSQRGRLRP